MWIICFPLDVCPAQLSALTVPETYFETATLCLPVDQTVSDGVLRLSRIERNPPA